MDDSAVYFDEIDTRDLGLFFQSGHENPIAPGTRDRITVIPGRPGALDYGAELEPIPFSLPFEIAQETRMDVQRIVRRVKSIIIDDFGKPRTFKLRFGYEPDKYFLVRYSGSIPIERLITIGKFSLPLMCFDGHALSVIKSSDVTWGEEAITFMNEIYTFGHSTISPHIIGESERFTVSVVGSAIRPLITVTGTGQNVSIGWDGKTFNLGAVSGTVIVDLYEYVVMRDGVYSLHTITGDWLKMHLLPGETNIEVKGNGLDLSISFDFLDRFF